jgi:hypothetical protein
MNNFQRAMNLERNAVAGCVQTKIGLRRGRNFWILLYKLSIPLYRLRSS